MKKQSRVVTASWGDLSDAIARGDVAITFNGWETMQKFCADKGKMVEIHLSAWKRTYAWLDNYCIAKDAPNLDAAYELCNRVIDVDGAEAPCRGRHPGDRQLGGDRSTDPATSGRSIRMTRSTTYGKKASFFGFPPTEPDGDLTTFSDWLKAYERFKTA